MLGSAFEADDAVQETLVRAWRSFDRFEGRSAVRSWLYRIATNVCFDMLNGRQRRARPMDLSSPKPSTTPLGPMLPEVTWIQPIPDGRVLVASDDPAEQTVARESIRLAFVAALQHLPPRQRAVLILREVLRLKAEEVAELLGSTVASVNSALQRARSTLAASDLSDTDAIDPMDDAHRELLDRYVDAFERYDMESLTSLLHEDATMSMPPYELWMRGHADISGWMLGTGMRLSRLAPRAHVGERHAGVRAVPAEWSGRQPRAVGAPGHRGLRRSDRRHQLVPRHGEPVPDVRSAGTASGIARDRAPRFALVRIPQVGACHPQPIHRKCGPDDPQGRGSRIVACR